MDTMTNMLWADSSPVMVALRRLLDVSLQATLLLLLAGSVVLLLRRVSAATRHLCWLLTLSGLLMLPLLNNVIPGRQALIRPAPEIAPLATRPALSLPRGREAERAAIVVAASAQRVAQSPHKILRDHSESAFSANWPLGILGAWLIGLLVVGARVVLGLRGLQRLDRQSVLLGQGRLVEQMHAAQQSLHLERHVTLRLAQEDCAIPMPLTWGWRQPVVLLPADAAAWAAEQQRAVLLHELAHIARGDWAAMLVAHAACAFFWFHPLAWWSARCLRAESERATDDRVLLAGVRAGDYGACLLEMVRALRTGVEKPAPKWAIAMASPSRLEDRLQAILDPRRNRRGVSRGHFILAFALASCVVALFGTVRVMGRASADEMRDKATGATKLSAAVSGRADLSGALVLQKSAAAYAALRTYVGTSGVVSTAEFSTTNRGKKKPQTLHQTARARIQFVRPGRMRIDGRDVGNRAFTIVSDGRKTRRKWPLVNGGRFETVASLEVAIGGMTGVAANAPTTIPAALMNLNWGGVFGSSASAKLLGLTKVNGAACFHIVTNGPHQKTTYWVDSRNFLLRRLQVEQTEKQLTNLMKKVPSKYRSQLKSVRMLSRRVTESFATEAVNKSLEAKLFQLPR